MSIQIAVTVDPSNPNTTQINAAIALLEALKTGLIYRGAPALPIGEGDDNPSEGVDVIPVPGPAEAYGLNPPPNVAFAPGGVPAAAAAAPNASTAATPTGTAPAATSTPGATSGVELDKNGMPHDVRIHSENKAKVQDGSWRYRRNLDPAVKAQVEAELRAVMALPAGAGAAPAPNAPSQAPAPSAPHSASAAPVPTPTPPAPGYAAPAAPSPLPSTPATGAAVPTATGSGVPINSFVDFVGRIGVLIAEQKLTQPEVAAACLANGVTDLPLLATRPDLVPNVVATVNAMLAPKGFAL